MAIDFDKVPSYVRKEIVGPKKVIKQGVKGEFSLRIQEWLHYHEFSTAIDADYGPATATQVRAFQAYHGINSTGTVNRATWDLLVKPMNDALSPPDASQSDSTATTVAQVAEQHLKQTPIEIGGANRGPWVRLYCGGNDGEQWAWCAGFVSLILQQSCFYLGVRPPFEGSVSCDILKTQADHVEQFVKGIDVSKHKESLPADNEAAIFLRRKSKNDWDHTGFIIGSQRVGKDIVLHTIEGNTNNAGSREGIKAMRRTRTLSARGGKYDFVIL